MQKRVTRDLAGYEIMVVGPLALERAHVRARSENLRVFRLGTSAVQTL